MQTPEKNPESPVYDLSSPPINLDLNFTCCLYYCTSDFTISDIRGDDLSDEFDVLEVRTGCLNTQNCFLNVQLKLSSL